MAKFYCSLQNGTYCLYEAPDIETARREFRLDEGRQNVGQVRKATKDEIAWYDSMGGRVRSVT